MNRKRSKYSSECLQYGCDGQGTKPRNVVFVFLALLCSSISLLDAVYVVQFPFGATMEFGDRESSPDPTRSDGSLALLFAGST